MAWKRTFKSIQIAETDQSTSVRILIKVFLKKKLAQTRPEDFIKNSHRLIRLLECTHCNSFLSSTEPGGGGEGGGRG